MSWSYDPSLGTDKDKVRFLVDDTDDQDPLLENEEILFVLTQFSNIFRAAASCADTLAMKFAKQVGIMDSRGVQWEPQQQAEKYKELAGDLRRRAAEAGSTGIFAGGQSISGKQAQDDDTDRVAPGFTVNQHRNPTTIQDVPDPIIESNFL